MQPTKPPHEHAEMDSNRLPQAPEPAETTLSLGDEMEADNLLVEARPFLQVLASIITRLYGERSEEPLLTEQGGAEPSNE